LFVAGWAWDAATLLPLFGVSSVLPLDARNPSEVPRQLAHECTERKIDPVRIVGWSLGAALALDFAQQFPTLVRELVLVALRPAYPAEEIAWQRADLARDPQKAVEDFVRRCLLGLSAAQRQSWLATWRTGRPWSVAELEAGLNYLESRVITSAELDAVGARLERPISLWHGARDRIAPVQETEDLVKKCRHTKTVFLPQVGHFLLVEPSFLGQDSII